MKPKPGQNMIQWYDEYENREGEIGRCFAKGVERSRHRYTMIGEVELNEETVTIRVDHTAPRRGDSRYDVRALVEDPASGNTVAVPLGTLVKMEDRNVFAGSLGVKSKTDVIAIVRSDIPNSGWVALTIKPADAISDARAPTSLADLEAEVYGGTTTPVSNIDVPF